MTTQTGNCGSKTTTSVQRVCLTCDLPAFCRNYYYTGKLLTERDFSDEQRYARDKMRLHYRALHGWGVVCGLEVKPHPVCPDRRILIEPGLAIDDCGREIRVLKQIEKDLPLKPPPAPKSPCPPDEAEPPEPSEHYSDDWREREREPEREREGEREHEPEHEREHDREHESGPRPNLYICIRYAECETEFGPAPFDECGCKTNGQRPGRVCEGYEIDILTSQPENWWERARHHHEDECWELYRRHEACPDMAQYSCIPLAIIRDYEPGDRVIEPQIDWEVRPVVRSTKALDEVIECILGKLRKKPLTKIVRFNWHHGEEIQCHHFIEHFVEGPRGFEITFGHPIVGHGINDRTFQAVIVRHQTQPHEPRRVEIAPARVEVEERSCRLHIDPRFARHAMHQHNYDLYIKLNCNMVLDHHGHPVDGNLLARLDKEGHYVVQCPTGDDVPGGEFESWIRVRT